MSANANVCHPSKPRRVLIVAANPAVSPITGWPVGAWAAEITHPYLTFVDAGYEVDFASPGGGAVEFDALSDPRHESGYSAADLISLGFIHTPALMRRLETTLRFADVNPAAYDAVFLSGGQSPMVTFAADETLHAAVGRAWDAGLVLGVVCHATCVLLRARDRDGRLLVEGRTWTGFADAEEQIAEQWAGQRIQPFWIETEANALPGTNFVTAGPFRAFAVRDGRLVTGQQQFSGAEAARLVIEAVGR